MAVVCDAINHNPEVMDVYIRLLQKDLVCRMKKKDIADFLHMTPNSFSKMRTKQKKDH